MSKITLDNIRGIKHLEFEIPKTKGVYLLTGPNGSGKTTLLSAIHRLFNNTAFQSELHQLDDLNEKSIGSAKFTYTNDAGDSVVYSKTKHGWDPHPKSNSVVLSSMGVSNGLYISTSGMRFYHQEPKNLNPNKRMVVANQDVINALNNILDTTKFSNLKYLAITGLRGRQKVLYRSNKLYMISKPGCPLYSEINFSLGEQLLLNAIDYIEKVQSGAFLIIDEIELALHPIAQVKFYDYLSELATRKNVRVLISTHSSTLIKHANKRFS